MIVMRKSCNSAAPSSNMRFRLPEVLRKVSRGAYVDEKKQEKADETCRNDNCSAGGREKGVPHTAVGDMGYQYIEGAHFRE